MKLDASQLRFMTKEEMRTLAAVEQLMKNHEMAPTEMIPRIARLRGGACKHAIDRLHHLKLLFHDSKPYDGYRLTYPGYDYLALKALCNADLIASVGNQIGVGKESDIYVAATADGERVCLKFHRLGRTSFRAVKAKRDYLRNNTRARPGNWMYFSRLAALKEFTFLRALYDVGYPVPRPLRVNRHVIAMELVANGVQLAQVRELADAPRVFARLMELMVRLCAVHGLVHCDFNEFNVLLDALDGTCVTVIDMPQAVSVSHANAQLFFERDVECLRAFFERRFKFSAEHVPSWQHDVLDALEANDAAAADAGAPAASASERLDVELKASGFSRDVVDEFEQLLEERREHGGHEEEEEGEEAEVEEIEGDGGEEEEDDDDDDDEEGEQKEEDEEAVAISFSKQEIQARVREQHKKRFTKVSKSKLKARKKEGQKMKREIVNNHF